MAVSLDRQFSGQAQLVRLLLWRIGESTDIDVCLTAARSAHMITAEDELFLTQCLHAEEALRTHQQSGEHLTVDSTLIEKLRRCVDKLNRADSA